MYVSKMMIIGILYLTFILSCSLAEVSSFGESNRELKPQRESLYDLDLWNSHKASFNMNRYYHDGDRSDRNHLQLNKYRTDRAVISEPEMGVFRTRGKGKATVIRRGETVYVPNELPRKGKYKGSISVRVVDKNDNEVKSGRHRGGCRECPTDQTVIAAKGNSFVILPEPCPFAPRMWNHHSGPTPGSKIEEGVHTIRGSIGPKKRFCEYRYQVIVNHCDPLKPKEEDTVLECSAENVWGSICVVSCGSEKEALGPTEMECQENLTWSNPLPTCKRKTDCLPPKIKTKSKLSCQTANTSYSDSSYLPNGTTCKFRQNGQTISINCKEGRWLKSRKTVFSKQSNENMKKTNKSDDCNPNPCQNGGICLRSASNKGPPICKCRPQTQGVHCELRECYYNICENDGLCIYQNEERLCYCSSYYSGDRCQNYVPQ